MGVEQIEKPEPTNRKKSDPTSNAKQYSSARTKNSKSTQSKTSTAPTKKSDPTYSVPSGTAAAAGEGKWFQVLENCNVRRHPDDTSQVICLLPEGLLIQIARTHQGYAFIKRAIGWDEEKRPKGRRASRIPVQIDFDGWLKVKDNQE